VTHLVLPETLDVLGRHLVSLQAIEE